MLRLRRSYWARLLAVGTIFSKST